MCKKHDHRRMWGRSHLRSVNSEGWEPRRDKFIKTGWPTPLPHHTLVCYKIGCSVAALGLQIIRTHKIGTFSGCKRFWKLSLWDGSDDYCAWVCRTGGEVKGKAKGSCRPIWWRIWSETKAVSGRWALEGVVILKYGLELCLMIVFQASCHGDLVMVGCDNRWIQVVGPFLSVVVKVPAVGIFYSMFMT